MLVTDNDMDREPATCPTNRLRRGFLLRALLLAAGLLFFTAGFWLALAQTVSPNFFFWDNDIDHDGLSNTADNCSTVYNPTQSPGSGGRGNLCDSGSDIDGDGTIELSDNCPNEQLQEDGGNGFVPGPCPSGGLACTNNPGQEDYNQDGIGNACSPLSTIWEFCVNGPGAGVGWTYGFAPTGTYPAAVPVSGVVGTANDLALAFVSSINALPGTPFVATPAGPCFTVKTNLGTPFDFRIIPATGPPCSVPGNPVGCNFNPTITNFLASSTGSVPTLSDAGLAVLTLALVLAGARVILLRRRRGAQSG